MTWSVPACAHLLAMTCLCTLDQSLWIKSDRFQIWGPCSRAAGHAGSWTTSWRLRSAVVRVCGTQRPGWAWPRTPRAPERRERGAVGSRRAAERAAAAAAGDGGGGGVPCAPWGWTSPGCSLHLQPAGCLRCRTRVSSRSPQRSPRRSTRTRGWSLTRKTGWVRLCTSRSFNWLSEQREQTCRSKNKH